MKAKIHPVLLLTVFVLLEFGFSYLVLNKASHTTSDSEAYVQIVKKMAGENVEWPDRHWTSNFLSPFLTSLLYRITKSMDVSYTITALLFYLILGVLAYFMGKYLKLDTQLSLIFALLVVSHPITIGYSGLYLTDVPSLTMEIIAILVLLLSSGLFENTVAFSLAVLTRPQLFALFPMYFPKLKWKSLLGILILSAVAFYAWSALSNAPIHPIWQYLENYFKDYTGYMVAQGKSYSSSFKAQLMDLFVGMQFIFFYQMLFLVVGLMYENKERLLTLGLPAVTYLVVLFLYPLKVPRYFLPLLPFLTFWAVLGMDKVFTKVNRKLLVPAVIGLILLNNVLALLYFKTGIHPLPS